MSLLVFQGKSKTSTCHWLTRDIILKHNIHIEVSPRRHNCIHVVLETIKPKPFVLSYAEIVFVYVLERLYMYIRLIIDVCSFPGYNSHIADIYTVWWSVWGTQYGDLWLRYTEWWSVCEVHSMVICVWGSQYGDLCVRYTVWWSVCEVHSMVICVWGTQYGDLCVRYTVWWSVFEVHSMVICVWGTQYGDLSVRYTVWWSVF